MVVAVNAGGARDPPGWNPARHRRLETYTGAAQRRSSSVPNHPMLQPLFVIVSIALLAAPAGQVTVALGPQSGTKRTKVIERHERFSLSELEISIDGVNLEARFAQLDFLLDNKLELAVTDTYRGISGDRVSSVARRFDKLRLTTRQSLSARSLPSPQKTKIQGSSPLQGRTVVFDRLANGSLDVHLEEGTQAPGSLKGEEWAHGLQADLDFTAFLPPTPVEKGDRWKVDPASLTSVFVPGGDLHFHSDPDSSTTLGGAVSLDAPSLDNILEAFEGTVNAHLESVVERSGERVARIQLELRIESARDLSGRSDVFRPVFPDSIEFEPATLAARYRFEGSGILEWNLDVRVLEQLDIEGQGAVTIAQTGLVKIGDLEQELKQDLSLSGPQTLSVVCGGD